MSSISDELKAAGKEILIDTYLEFYHDEVIATVRKFLNPFSPDDIRRFVAEGKAPPMPAPAIEALSGYEDYLESLKPEELFQWLAEARRDLAEALASLGDEGADYMVRLKSFILDSIRDPEGAPNQAAESIVKLTCESCGAEWRLPRSQAEKVTLCPFCGAGKEEPPQDE